jgi:hypothetical protein
MNNESILMINREENICYIDEYGTKFWRLNGLLHREDGPAVEWPDGDKDWYVNGKRHRVDGPAIIHFFLKAWWINGKEYSTEGEWFQALTLEQQYNYLWNLNE